MSKWLNEPLAASLALVLLAFAGLISPAWRPISAVAATLIGLMLVTFFHELGHCLVGVAQGYRLLFIVAGPLRFEETPAGPRVLVNRSWEYAGGVCASLPDRVSADRLRRAQMLQYLAGPLTSLAIGVATFLIGGRGLALPAALIGAASLGMGLASLVPSRQGAIISDGLGFLTLRRGGPDAERLLRRVRLAAAIYTPARPAAWPSDDVAAIARDIAERPLPPSDPEWQNQLSDRSIVYYHLIDCGEGDRAGALFTAVGVDEAAARVRSVTVQSYIIQAAFHAAWYARNAAEARRWLALVPRVSLLLESDRQRALAAVSCCEGDREAARAALARAQATIPVQLANTGVGALERQWLTELGAALK